MDRPLWSTLDALFRDVHLNFGPAPGRVPTMRVECTLPDGRWVASYFEFDTTIGEMVAEMSQQVQAATEVSDAS